MLIDEQRRISAVGRLLHSLIAGAMLLASLAVFLAPASTVLAAAGTISGRVYDDYNGDGNMSAATTLLAAEPGVAGVTVRGYDSTGALVATATTAAGGTYTLNIASAASTAIRVEFDTPTGYVASPTDMVNTTTPYTGASNMYRPGPIQFAVINNTYVDYAMMNPKTFVNPNDKVAVVQMWQGASNVQTTASSIWSSTMALAGPTLNVAKNTETGALWGLAWNQTKQRLWSSAVIRRAAGLGPKGIGGVYVVDQAPGASNVVASFDLRDYGVVLENVTTSGGTDYDNSDRNLPAVADSYTNYYDLPGYFGVGLEGIGDIDFSKDDRYLYVVNLYQRKIHRFEVGGTADAPTLTNKTDFQVPDTSCTAPNIARPWGIEVTEDGVLNVGAVCTSLVSGTTALTARPDPEKGVILRLDPTSASWSELTTISFGYTRDSYWSNYNSPGAAGAVLRETSSNWQEWTNDFDAINTIADNQWDYFDWSQPIISDIETVSGGGFYLGITNRFDFQVTDMSRLPQPTQPATQNMKDSVSSGDTIFMCKSGSGWLQDRDAACKNSADWVGDTTLHGEATLGALASYGPDSGMKFLAVTAMDASSAYTGGFVRSNSSTGVLTMGSAGVGNDFSKGAAMGDIEILLQQAPISIGNTLWYDNNNNGIQDAGEPGVSGATVRLYDSTGTLVGTAITNNTGEYYFSTAVSEVAAGNGNYAGGGIVAGETYTIRVDNPTDYTTSGRLLGYGMTAPDKLSAASALDDQIDSDATIVSSYPRITVPAMNWGDTNYSYDIGFAKVVSIGDRVWLDTDRDQVQDAGETGVAGVTVALTYADGSPVYDVSGNLVTSKVTDANGNYSFTNLPTAPAGTYKVTMTPPTGYAATTAVTKTSSALTTAGASDLTLDFGLAPSVTVGNFVWSDTDRDGVQDAGEPGLAGVVMTITKADGTAVTDVAGNAVTTTTTDANGLYQFTNLPYGSYKVSVATPAGYTATVTGAGTTATDSSTGNATSANLQTAGASDLTLDFGFVPNIVSVGNFVWRDTDRDGVQDAGEPGIAGVVMTITKADGSAVTDVNGNAVTTTTTDANGAYLFSNLPPGSYKVSVATPAGYTATITGAGTTATDSSTGNATSANLTTNGASDLTLDFGFVPITVSVGNFVWKDTDRDGVQDAGEPGIAGVVMSITKADGSAVTDINGNAVTTTTTDSNGAYLFSNLPPGSYKVSVATPTGMTATVSGAGTAATDSSTGNATSATLSVDGASDLTLDFGFVDLPVSVGNLVWNDLDRDGVQDADETGIAGVVLTITKADGTAVTDVNGNSVTTTTTDATGAYLFSNLPPGSYKVTATTPSGYTSTTAGVGADRGIDSSSGFATTASLVGGTSDLTLDFGFYLSKVSVGDLVWFDTNHDGIKDAGEPGLSGITVTITKADGSAVTDIAGNPVVSTTTDVNGNYVFANLPVGAYKVSVAAPTGMAATLAGVGSDRAVDSSTGNATSATLSVDGTSDLTLDFGFWAPPATVGSRVWRDLDNDGIQDPGEPGIAGVTMTITKGDGTTAFDTGGNPVTSVVTDADGNYVFTNLAIGTDYKVTVGSVPAGFIPSPPGVGSDRAVDSSTSNATSIAMDATNLVDLSLDFGFNIPTVSVGDLVWLDSDGDGVRDAGEPGMAGVTVTITKADGSAVTSAFGAPVSTAVTDANGNYSFTDLPPGSYKVTMTTPSGYVATTAVNKTSSTLTNNQSDLTLDFGVVPKVSVGNLVWVDTNRDGIKGSGELGLAGVTLSITKADGTAVTDVFGQSVTTTTTDANGNYLFDNLPYGTYKVSVVDPAGYIPTLAAQGGDATLDSSSGNATSSALSTPGASDLTLDFGFVLPKVSVGNLVWVDTNRDGIKDVGESGLAGVTLSITKADGSAVTDVFGNAVTTTTTDVNGNYLFSNLPAGSYKVTVIDPAGYVPTIAGAGSDRTVDSSTTNATSANLTTDGSSDLTLDFGFVLPKVSVGNLVWKDLNGDGLQNAGEPGISGVTLSITKADGSAVTDVFGNAVTTTTTDANGNYLFANLPFGSYKVTVVDPAGYTATLSGQGSSSTDSSTGNATSSNLTVDGAADATLDFGFYAPMVSVGNLVWFDTNHDGVQDAGEAGVAGAVLTITKMDGSSVTNVFGAAVGSITTDSTGRFLFDNLPPGQYKVSIASPAGFAPTIAGAGTAITDSAVGVDVSANLPNDGDSDMTLDFGFFPVAVSVGNLVWLDTNADGVQGADEKGIAGVTLTITKADGSAVTDVVGNPVTTTTTDANGKYLFSNLPPGQYKVTVTPPAGMLATKTGAGTTATDSSTGSATSVNLPNNGDADLTLDFGFVVPPVAAAQVVPRVSVGDFVWFDTNRDGIQDADEKGIAGVTLSITNTDGSPVTDVNGKAVTTTVTDANGKYLFADLPPGQYKVTITPPSGYSATKTGAGATATDSSSGSATSANLLANGDSDMSLDFGFVKTSVPVTPPQEAKTAPQTSYGFTPQKLAKPSDGAKFDNTKTVIADATTGKWSKNVVAKGGTWTVEDGKIKFTPDPGFVGKATVNYQLTDTSGQVAASKLTIVVTEDAKVPVTGASPWLFTCVAMILLLVGALARFFASRKRRIRFGRIRYSNLAEKAVSRGRGIVAIVLAVVIAVAPSPLSPTRVVRAAAAPTSGTVPGSGKYIELIFGYVVDTTKPPSLSAFTVKSGSSTVAVSGIRYLSTIVYLDLASTIYGGDTVTLSYAAPTVDNTLANNALQRSNGDDTISFTDLAITNVALPKLTPNTPAKPTVSAGEESATITVAAPASGRAPTSYTVTASPGGKTCTITGSSGACTISGLTAGTAYTFSAVATNSAGDSGASEASDSVTVLAKQTTTTTTTTAPTSQNSSQNSSSASSSTQTTTTTTISAGSLAGRNGPTWDVEPATDSEIDANTEGYLPESFPGNIVITNEFGFVVDAKGAIKPKIRMKSYSGVIRMSLSATYVDAGKTKKFACKFARFGTRKKIKAAKWRWYSPKKSCLLPTALVASIRSGKSTLAASGKWARIWSTTAAIKRPDGTKILPRNLRFSVRSKR